MFALPNGNTIEQSVGKKLNSGDDWYYDIQHIGAQTRFLRNQSSGTNLVVVYLGFTKDLAVLEIKTSGISCNNKLFS